MGCQDGGLIGDFVPAWYGLIGGFVPATPPPGTAGPRSGTSRSSAHAAGAALAAVVAVRPH
ncbi:hypothetical protein ACFT8W_36810 [Streptomyces hygroscopicus]|uniref:hypothetical protein n=1 Tax=Streptomyces hygroscopicus TaxID=1912 RepID=UPI0036250641